MDIAGGGVRWNGRGPRGTTNTSHVLRGSQNGEGRRGGGYSTRWKIGHTLSVINTTRRIVEGQGPISWVNLRGGGIERKASGPVNCMSTNMGSNLSRVNVGITPLAMKGNTGLMVRVFLTEVEGNSSSVFAPLPRKRTKRACQVLLEQVDKKRNGHTYGRRRVIETFTIMELELVFFQGTASLKRTRAKRTRRHSPGSRSKRRENKETSPKNTIPDQKPACNDINQNLSPRSHTLQYPVSGIAQKNTGKYKIQVNQGAKYTHKRFQINTTKTDEEIQ